MLNHAPRGTVLWDPLYAALGLGPAVNVTLLANERTMAVASEHLSRVAQSTLPKVPPVWDGLLDALLPDGPRL